MRRLGICVLAAAATACSDPPRPAPAEVWTLFDLEALYAADPRGAVAVDGGLPGGVPLDRVLVDDPATHQPRLYDRGTLAESYPGKYVTTEVWQGFDQLWIQPLYVPVTGWKTGTFSPFTEGWVFGVGPQSGFYSPFWQLVYVEVDDGATPGVFKSVREIIDGGYTLHPEGGRTVALVPDDIVLPPPLTGLGTGYLDGKAVSFINFGDGTFQWDAAGVITEIPLFVFLMTDNQGQAVAPAIPTVAGAGPLGSNTPAPPRVDRKLAYASYWRIYTVTLPSTARVFAPPGSAELVSLEEQGLKLADRYSAAATANMGLLGRVAVNPECFEGDGSLLDPDPTNLAGGRCIWLDSQADIEANIDPTSIRRTEITVTCPFVSYDEPG